MLDRTDHLALGAHDVAIWCCQTGDYSDELLATLAHTLSPEEQARAARFVRRGDRRDFIAAHALLRHALSRHDGARRPQAWRLVNSPAGKPGLLDEPESALRFNVSHTTGFAACAVARQRHLGIDVERIRELDDAPAIAQRYFAPSEAAMLGGLDGRRRTERFVELWTLKEAHVKAVGSGLGMPLDSFAFTFERDGLRFNATAATTDVWRFWLFEPAPGTRLALCAQASRGGEPLRIVFGDTHEPLVLLRQSAVPD